VIFFFQSCCRSVVGAFVVILLLTRCSCPAQSNDSAPALSPPANDPVCGYISGPHFFRAAGEVKRGLSVDLLVGETHIGQPLPLRFFVNQKPANIPEDNLLVEHDKFIHVIGVRDDLREFFHIHPLKAAPGLWEVIHTFTQGGNYKIWTDIKRAGVAYTFAQPTIVISGARDSLPAAPPTDNDTAQIGAWKLQFFHPDKVTSGSTNQYSFLVTGKDGQPAVLENYLAAKMHLVWIKEGLQTYLHAHPDSAGVGRTKFTQAFPEPGRYKLFAQFRPERAQLEKDEALLAEFYLTVAEEPKTLTTR
jgi:hypothetical protein